MRSRRAHGRSRRFGSSLLAVATACAFAALLPAQTVSAAPTANAVVTGLDAPAMFTVASDGRIFYAELWKGRIGVFDPADSSDTTYFQVPGLCNAGDQGVNGLALHPQFPAVPSLYAYATRRTRSGSCSNQVLRLDGAPGTLTMRVLASDPYTAGHIGGRMLFGSDGNLYVSTGDGASDLPTAEAARAQRTLVQDLNSLKGKVLRMTPDGAVPADNPFGNHVFAFGFRNVFGFDFDPVTSQMWATDNGPDPRYPGDPRGPGPNGGCNDELNLVLKGMNYGWGPRGNCGKPPEAPFNTNQDGRSRVLPRLNHEAATGITGARFCAGCGLGRAYEGRLFYVRFGYADGTGEIRAATLSADRSTIVSDALVLRPDGSSPLSIERGPDGSLYYSTMVGIYRLVGSGGAVAVTTTTSPLRAP